MGLFLDFVPIFKGDAEWQDVECPCMMVKFRLWSIVNSVELEEEMG
jgi:hypothetical protein